MIHMSWQTVNRASPISHSFIIELLIFSSDNSFFLLRFGKLTRPEITLDRHSTKMATRAAAATADLEMSEGVGN